MRLDYFSIVYGKSQEFFLGFLRFFTRFSADFKFQFIALFNCTVGNAVLGVPSEIPLDGQIFCIFLHQSAKMLRFALGTLRTAFPTGLHGNRAINSN